MKEMNEGKYQVTRFARDKNASIESQNEIFELYKNQDQNLEKMNLMHIKLYSSLNCNFLL